MVIDVCKSLSCQLFIDRIEKKLYYMTVSQFRKHNLISLSIEPCNNITYLKVKVKWLLSILWLTWNWKWFPICFLIFWSNICDIGALLVQLIDNTALRISFSVDFRSRCLSKGLNQQIIIHRVRLQFKENMKK